ncbi:cupin domain-containing protein [Clostridium bovifaecis]|uniref:Cupin domain-containing protein n=1 Tax=Clostridium bovifaecis TaxID=2184719 RepID=A0A6I6ERP0_9CLOT|nr:cupin domain-containing protein [Clostridium bovifaecis]
MKIAKVKEKMEYLPNSITKRVLFSEEKVLNFVLNLMPGQEIPPHQHENSDLILYVLEGAGKLTIDEKKQDIIEGDVVYCTGEEMLSLVNNKDNNLSCFVVITPRPGLHAYSKEVGEK